jgi:hypothetical protein
MFDANQTPDVLFSIVALAFPVLGVILLLLAAHVVGGAMRPRDHGGLRIQRSSRVQQRSAADRVTRRPSRVRRKHHV